MSALAASIGIMSQLERSVVRIIAYIGQMAAGYGGHVKWNEIAKFKADMMNVRRRWMDVDVEAVSAECRAVGLTSDDTAKIVEMLKKVQAGRKLAPQGTYRAFRFPFDPDPPAGQMHPRD